MSSALLGLFLLASMMLKTGHLLMLEHAHHHVPVCPSEHNNHATHLHDERFNPDTCSICAFLFAVPELPPLARQLNAPLPYVDRKPSGNFTAYPCSSITAIYLRGPPAWCRIAHC